MVEISAVRAGASVNSREKTYSKQGMGNRNRDIHCLADGLKLGEEHLVLLFRCDANEKLLA